MSRTKRPHFHELPSPPEANGLKWLTADRTTQDEADRMQELWNHYRQRTAARTSLPK